MLPTVTCKKSVNEHVLGDPTHPTHMQVESDLRSLPGSRVRVRPDRSCCPYLINDNTFFATGPGWVLKCIYSRIYLTVRHLSVGNECKCQISEVKQCVLITKIVTISNIPLYFLKTALLSTNQN